jgi:hypothetical protein
MQRWHVEKRKPKRAQKKASKAEKPLPTPKPSKAFPPKSAQKTSPQVGDPPHEPAASSPIPDWKVPLPDGWKWSPDGIAKASSNGNSIHQDTDTGQWLAMYQGSPVEPGLFATPVQAINEIEKLEVLITDALKSVPPKPKAKPTATTRKKPVRREAPDNGVPAYRLRFGGFVVECDDAEKMAELLVELV